MRASRRLLVLALVAAVPGAAAADERAAPGAKEAFQFPGGTVVAGLRPSPTSTPAQQTAASAQAHAQTMPARTVGPMKPAASRREPPAPVWVGLRYWIELLRVDPRSPGLPVPPDQRFRSGDRVRLHFESNVPGHLAIYQLGSSGAASLLFPGADSGRTSQLVEAREDSAIPDGAAWFRFDHQPGVERLLVVFAARAEQLADFALAPHLATQATAALIARAGPTGSKDLVLETERDVRAEIGTFVVNLAGQAIVLPIDLQHE